MAVIRPLKINEPGGDLQEMTSAEVQLLINEVIRLYANDPGIELSVTSGSDDGTGYQYKLSTMNDNRLQASDAATASFPYPTPASVSYKTIAYSDTLLNMVWRYPFPYKDRAGSAYVNHSYPIFYNDPSGYVKAAGWQDMVDTFIKPALQSLTSGTLTPEAAGGTYFVSTNTSETDATLVSPNLIARDTIADVTAFSSGSLPEVVDQPLNSSTVDYFLHKINAPAEFSFTLPAVIESNNIKTMPLSPFREMLLHLVQYWSVWGTSQQISLRYQYGSSSFLTGIGMITRGTGIADSYASNQIIRQDQNAPNPNATIYYAQSVPSGTATVQTTNYLGVGLQ
tara:strand:+ start:260 stop:1276 length:1017 start_codon:yes stop_codon:yes gene_type:complete